jgi:hypothetical protein
MKMKYPHLIATAFACTVAFATTGAQAEDINTIHV